MSAREIRILRLDADGAAAGVPGLAEVLVDCVDGGASVSFMRPLAREKATTFWARVAEGVRRGERALLVAVDETESIVGTVQLLLAVPENQPHRAEVVKLLVHRRARRLGVAARLLAAAEREARIEGRSLLVLDTVSGSDADRLYRRSGWIAVGSIPGYALMPDGSPCAATFFYRDLAP